MSERVSIDLKDGIADVRMIRTDKMNAIDAEMFTALVEAGRSLCAERSVRAVVLSGEGRAFCAGLDMGSFTAMADGTRGTGPGSAGTCSSAARAARTARSSRPGSGRRFRRP